MLSSAASTGTAPSRLERLKRWYRSETIDPVKRSCNLVREREERKEKGGRAERSNSSRISISRPLILLSSSLLSHSPRKQLQQSLLRAIGLFVGGVIVARNFGDAFNV